MPLHKLLLIMCKNLSFSNNNFQNLLTVGGETPPHPTPSPRSVASLPRLGPPVEKSWLRQWTKTLFLSLKKITPPLVFFPSVV